MKTTILKSAVMAVVVAAMLVCSVYSQEERGGGSRRLAGAWDAEITIRNCSTAAPIRQFYSVGAFHEGGTFSGITSGTPQSLRSPEIGVWRHVRGGQYVFRFKAFMFDAAGMPINYQVVTHTLALDPDNANYTSAGGVQVFNMAGTQIGVGCSTGVGTRMQLD